MRSYLPLIVVLLAGCWKDDATTLVIDSVPFAPTEEIAPEGWSITLYEMPLVCPDGENGNFYVLHPDAPTGPVPVAVLLHSGAFDYIVAPTETDPISGDHFASPERRLDREWSVRRVFATLGMFSDNDAQEMHTGALPVALANAGIATILPANCWGDYWRNDSTLEGHGNAAAEEFMEREGLQAARFAWDVATRANADVVLPFEVDQSQLYLLGQGEGGRGVTELLTTLDPIDMPNAIMVDSTADDLRIFLDSPVAEHQRIVSGLKRIWPDEDTEEALKAGSMGFLPIFPNRVAYVYSSLDTIAPLSTHERALARLANQNATFRKWDVQRNVHVPTAGDPVLTAQVVAYLVDGTEPE